MFVFLCTVQSNVGMHLIQKQTKHASDNSHQNSSALAMRDTKSMRAINTFTHGTTILMTFMIGQLYLDIIAKSLAVNFVLLNIILFYVINN